MKKFLAAIFVAVVLFVANLSPCNAEPTYETEDAVLIPGYRSYRASVSDSFFQYSKYVIIDIEKSNTIKEDGSSDDLYLYAIQIRQLTKLNPFRVKSVLIMSETDSVEISANDSGQFKGLNFFTERIVYDGDPGKVNRVIKSVWSKMLIRITTTSGAVYDYYPSSQYITYAKKVADWASR